MEFLLQPAVYKTGTNETLLDLLDSMWIKSHEVGAGTIHIVSGFANYNGGVRFYPFFTRHVQSGGKVSVFISGSTSQRLSSMQVAEVLLQCGAELHVINRKRLVHAKCYGYANENGEELVVSSGNFTGPGMTQNVEAAVHVENDILQLMGFSWTSLEKNILSQKWDLYSLDVADIDSKKNPGWDLLYDEVHDMGALDETQQTTMILTLSHSDTARIQAEPGTNAAKGTQYFWLSKKSFDFFPALTEKNRRGRKNTYSCVVEMNYIDIGIIAQSRVTFEADNNLDFRLGTAPLKNTKTAEEGDMALITRNEEYKYELRIIKKGTKLHQALMPYATSFIGNYGKKTGFIGNTELNRIIDNCE